MKTDFLFEWIDQSSSREDELNILLKKMFKQDLTRKELNYIKDCITCGLRYGDYFDYYNKNNYGKNE